MTYYIVETPAGENPVSVQAQIVAMIPNTSAYLDYDRVMVATSCTNAPALLDRLGFSYTRSS